MASSALSPCSPPPPGILRALICSRWATNYLRASCMLGQQVRVLTGSRWLEGTITDVRISPRNGEVEVLLEHRNRPNEYLRLDDLEGQLNFVLDRHAASDRVNIAPGSYELPGAPASAAQGDRSKQLRDRAVDGTSRVMAVFSQPTPYAVSTRSVWVQLGLTSRDNFWPAHQQLVSRSCKEEAIGQKAGLVTIQLPQVEVTDDAEQAGTLFEQDRMHGADGALFEGRSGEGARVSMSTAVQVPMNMTADEGAFFAMASGGGDTMFGVVPSEPTVSEATAMSMVEVDDVVDRVGGKADVGGGNAGDAEMDEDEYVAPEISSCHLGDIRPIRSEPWGWTEVAEGQGRSQVEKHRKAAWAHLSSLEMTRLKRLASWMRGANVMLLRDLWTSRPSVKPQSGASAGPGAGAGAARASKRSTKAPGSQDEPTDSNSTEDPLLQELAGILSSPPPVGLDHMLEPLLREVRLARKEQLKGKSRAKVGGVVRTNLGEGAGSNSSAAESIPAESFLMPVSSDPASSEKLQGSDFVGLWVGWWAFGIPVPPASAAGLKDTAALKAAQLALPEYACRASASIEMRIESDRIARLLEARGSAEEGEGLASRKKARGAAPEATVGVPELVSDLYPGGLANFDTALPPAFFLHPQLSTALQRAGQNAALPKAVTPSMSCVAYAAVASGAAEWTVSCSSLLADVASREEAQAQVEAVERGKAKKKPRGELAQLLASWDVDALSPSKGNLRVPDSVLLSGWAGGKPGPQGRWVVGWVARYCPHTRMHLVVYDWPSAVGCHIPSAAAQAAGVTRPLLHREWIDLMEPTADRLPAILPRAGPLAGLHQPDPAFAREDRDVQGASKALAALPFSAEASIPRCCWCLHPATRDDPLLMCSRAPLLPSSLPYCGQFAHLLCMGPGTAQCSAGSFLNVAHEARLALVAASLLPAIQHMPGHTNVYRIDRVALATLLKPGSNAASSLASGLLLPTASALLNWQCDNCLQCSHCGSRFPRGTSMEFQLQPEARDLLLSGRTDVGWPSAGETHPIPWRVADADNRGMDPEEGTWKVHHFEAIPGDLIFSNRLRSMSGRPALPYPVEMEFRDRMDQAHADASCKGTEIDAKGESAADLAPEHMAAVRAICHPTQLGSDNGASLPPNEVPYDYDGPLRYIQAGVKLEGVPPQQPVDVLVCQPCSKRCSSKHFCPMCNGPYHADSGHMLQCERCDGWVHARCDGLSRDDLSNVQGDVHPDWKGPYMCGVCRRLAMKQVLKWLKGEDKAGFFHMPVTAELAPGYFNVISRPMSLHALEMHLTAGDYDTQGPSGAHTFRADVELIVRNALVFNTPQDRVYRDAWKFLKAIGTCMKWPPKHRIDSEEFPGLPFTSDVAFRAEFSSLRTMLKGDAKLASEAAASASNDFQGQGNGGPHSSSAMSALQSGTDGTTGRRIKGASDGDVDAVASRLSARNAMLYDGSSAEHTKQVVSSLPIEWREIGTAPPLLIPSVLVLPEVRLSSEEAAVFSRTDACAMCGSSGHPWLMVFCMDCGEAHHLYCSLQGQLLRTMSEAAKAMGMSAEQVKEVEHHCLSTIASPNQQAVLHSPVLAEVVKVLVAANRWRCGNCKVCETCGECRPDHENRLLVCDNCDAGQHTFCCEPVISIVPEGSWYCTNCFQCSGCGKGMPGKPNHAGAWSMSKLMCLDCLHYEPKNGLDAVVLPAASSVNGSKPTVVGPTYKWSADEVPQENCPGCNKPISESDNSMVQCDSCNRWVHARCDKQVFPTLDVYEAMIGYDSQLFKYACQLCRDTVRGADKGQVDNGVRHAELFSTAVRLASNTATAILATHTLAGLQEKSAHSHYHGHSADVDVSSELAQVLSRSQRGHALRSSTAAHSFLFLNAHPVHSQVGDVPGLPLSALWEEASQCKAVLPPEVDALLSSSSGQLGAIVHTAVAAASFSLAAAMQLSRERKRRRVDFAGADEDGDALDIDTKRQRPDELAAMLDVDGNLSPAGIITSPLCVPSSSVRSTQTAIAPLPAHENDPRMCSMCGLHGDMETGVWQIMEAASAGTSAGTGTAVLPRGIEGHLIPIPSAAFGATAPCVLNRWLHLMCAYSAMETALPEGTDGNILGIAHTAAAITRALTATCAYCGFAGAGIICHTMGCTKAYHVRCSMVAGCTFPGIATYGKEMLCASHAAKFEAKEGRGRGRFGAAQRAVDAPGTVTSPPTTHTGRFPTMEDLVAAYSVNPDSFSLIKVLNHAYMLPALAKRLLRWHVCVTRAPVDLSECGIPEAASGPPLPEQLQVQLTVELLQSKNKDKSSTCLTPTEVLAVARSVSAAGGGYSSTSLPGHDRAMATLLAVHPGLAADHPGHVFPVVRVGACTVLRWGRLVTLRPGYATPSIILPVGFRARRIWWGPNVTTKQGVNGEIIRTLQPGLARVTYTCDVLDMYGRVMDTARGRAAVGLGDDSNVASFQQVTQDGAALFVITCDDYPALRVASRNADEALQLLRIQLVTLVGAEASGHFLSREERAVAAVGALPAATVGTAQQMISSELLAYRHGARLRWRRTLSDSDGRPWLYLHRPTVRDALGMADTSCMDKGLPGGGDGFGLQGPVWMGFGLPTVQRALEGLPEAALLQITPVGTSTWWPRFEYRCSIPAPGVIAEARAIREADARRAEAEGGLCSRLSAYDRSNRETARHHSSSLLAARIATLNDPALGDTDRAAVGDPLLVLGGGMTAGAGPSGPVDDMDESSHQSSLPHLWEPSGAGAPSERVEGAAAAAAIAVDNDGNIPAANTMAGISDEIMGPEGASSAAAPSSCPLSDFVTGNERAHVSSDAAIMLSYRAMRGWAMSSRIVVRRSPIHGWGLVLKADVPRDSVMIEYNGELVRQPVADRREIMYEEMARSTGRFAHMAGAGAGAGSVTLNSDLANYFGVPLDGHRSDGSGSCYLFRLDDEWIVDATLRGGPARFINHCCEPNCYSKVITVEGARRIVICAMRDLRRGEELTYHYKFPIETDTALKIPCYCGARSCEGTMN